jgi:elongation factor Ts
MTNLTTLDKIKELRNLTGASIVECKAALLKMNNNLDEAILFLKKKNIADAAKKLFKKTIEGIIFAYIHSTSKVGVMLELNCETDFVAKSKEFKDLAKMLAMQIISNPNILYISKKDIPSEKIEKERNIIKNISHLIKNEKELDLLLEKQLENYTLVNQFLINDSTILVKDYIKTHISLLGENIQIKRFIRYDITEKDNNF